MGKPAWPAELSQSNILDSDVTDGAIRATPVYLIYKAQFCVFISVSVWLTPLKLVEVQASNLLKLGHRGAFKNDLEHLKTAE